MTYVPKKWTCQKTQSKDATVQCGGSHGEDCIGCLGPLAQSATANKYRVMTADYFTKYTEAFAVPDQEATTVANLLVCEFVCRYQVPLEIDSNQGRNFESAVFSKMFTLMGMDIPHRLTHSQTCGIWAQYLDSGTKVKLNRCSN